MSKLIPLTQEKFAIVDDDLYEHLMQWKWHYTHFGYAQAFAKGEKPRRSLWMHRLVAATPEGMVTDHANGNRLDNRRDNLRVCTVRQNAMNSPKRKPGTSKYKGVFWFEPAKLWAARLRFGNEEVLLTYHPTEAEAAIVYNYYALKYHGEFAALNEIPDHEFPVSERDEFLRQFDVRREKGLVRNNTSGLLGVSWHKTARKWTATIRNPEGRSIYLGLFGLKYDAARAYNQKAREFFGELARVNVLPEDDESADPYSPLAEAA